MYSLLIAFHARDVLVTLKVPVEPLLCNFTTTSSTLYEGPVVLSFGSYTGLAKLSAVLALPFVSKEF